MLKTTEKEFKYNQRELTRNKIIFGDTLYKDDRYQLGQYKDFVGLTLPQLEELVEKRFIDPEGTHNYSPSAQDFLNFLRRHPQFTVIGYVIGKEREDYRVSIDGIECDTSGMDDAEFINTVCEFFSCFYGRQADVVKIERDRIHVWWD
jgi:hypothetical protein